MILTPLAKAIFDAARQVNLNSGVRGGFSSEFCQQLADEMERSKITIKVISTGLVDIDEEQAAARLQRRPNVSGVMKHVEVAAPISMPGNEITTRQARRVKKAQLKARAKWLRDRAASIPRHDL
jgi:hypothetical protein